MSLADGLTPEGRAALIAVGDLSEAGAEPGGFLAALARRAAELHCDGELNVWLEQAVRGLEMRGLVYFTPDAEYHDHRWRLTREGRRAYRALREARSRPARSRLSAFGA